MTNKISNSTRTPSNNSLNTKKQIKKDHSRAFAEQVKSNFKNSTKLDQKIQQVKQEDGTDIAYKKAAAEFEVSFEAFMYNLQFNTVEVDPLMGGGIGEEVFRSQLIEATIAKNRNGKPGEIAEAIYRSIRKNDHRTNNERTVSEYNVK